MLTQTPRNQSVVTEMEMLEISLAKYARSIIEELGTTCASYGENDDSEVEGGAEPYDSIDDVRAVMTRGEQLARIAWGKNAQDNLTHYVIGTGHMVTVKPKDENDPNDASVKRVQRFLDMWMKENDWQTRQPEVFRRLCRHGECPDLLDYESGDDGLLRVYFAEPTDFDDDSKSLFQDTEDTNKRFIDKLGVRRTNDIQYRPVAYFIDGAWYADLMYASNRGKGIPNTVAGDVTPITAYGTTDLIPSTAVLHRKRNMDVNDPRGLTMYWSVRDELTFGKRILSNMVRVSSFQAAFGAIRTIDQVHSADQVKSYLNSLQNGTVRENARETFDMPAAGVVTIPGTVKYEFPETGRGVTNTVEVLVQVLRACASGLGLPEFMLTSNVSEGNFASTLVSEGPYHKAISFHQQQIVNEDERLLWQALRFAALKGTEGLSAEDLSSVVLSIKPPRIQTRNRKEDFEVNHKLWSSGELSGKTMLAHEGHEREFEQAQISIERKNEIGPPMGAEGKNTGPAPEIQSGSLREKGVMAGEPPADPTKQ